MKTKKAKKKILISTGILAGILLIVSTAFADTVNRSAYDQLKDSVKFTAAAMTETIKNSTVRATVVVKDNGNVLFTQVNTTKEDRTSGSSENTSVTEYAGREASQTYNYSDNTGYITYDAASDTYYVTEYAAYGDRMAGTYSSDSNPFDSEEAADMEKIFDALVGSLKNYVVLTENPDGTKEFSGSLTDTQIPALINAIVSFAGKQYFSERTYASPVSAGASYDESAGSYESVDLFPSLSGDIAIKSVTGNAVVNKDGIITEVSAAGIITGTDKDGAVHDLSAEVLVRIEDINGTTVTKPDLTGKNVVISKDVPIDTPESLSAKFVGTYKNDIIIETDQAFEKIGERVLVIKSIAGGKITGSYTENYIEGYEDRLNSLSSFEFESVVSDPYNVMLQFTDKEGNIRSGNMYFDRTSFTIQFYIDNMNEMKNATFNRVFD